MMNQHRVLQPSAMSQLSHELRIPVTGILGLVHFLQATPLNSQQQEYLAGISASAQRLLSIEDKLHALLQRNSIN